MKKNQNKRLFWYQGFEYESFPSKCKKRTVLLASKINLALHIGDKQTGKNG